MLWTLGTAPTTADVSQGVPPPNSMHKDPEGKVTSSCSVRLEPISEGSGPSFAVASSGMAMPSPRLPSMNDSLESGITMPWRQAQQTSRQRQQSPCP